MRLVSYSLLRWKRALFLMAAFVRTSHVFEGRVWSLRKRKFEAIRGEGCLEVPPK